MKIERSRPFREVDRGGPTVNEREAPQGGSPAVAIDGPDDLNGADPDLRQRREFKDPDDGYDPPRTGRKKGPSRPGHGHGGYHRHRHYYGCGHYGYRYDPFYWGYGHYWPTWALGYYRDAHYYDTVYVSGGGAARRAEAAMGALDLDVRPDRAEVYVDGNFVDIADQYDGYPSYLWLEQGTYELAFYLEGYETVYLRYTIYPGVTIDVDVHLREGPSTRPEPPLGASPGASGAYGAERDPGLPGAGLPGGNDVGRIAVAATPADAAVYLDGHFVGTAEEIAQLTAGLIVEPGDHLIEVIRPGYEARRLPVSVAVGEQIVLKLDLERR